MRVRGKGWVSITPPPRHNVTRRWVLPGYGTFLECSTLAKENVNRSFILAGVMGSFKFLNSVHFLHAQPGLKSQL